VSADAKLKALGLTLPGAMVVPAGVELPFAFVNVVGNRAIISGHLPQATDGSIAGPTGKVGVEVDEETAYAMARQVGLSILASLKRELGSLDRITRWVRLFGMVNVAPEFNRLPPVINGASDLILEVFGPEIGKHARSAVGMAALPFDVPVEIEGEVLFD